MVFKAPILTFMFLTVVVLTVTTILAAVVTIFKWKNAKNHLSTRLTCAWQYFGTLIFELFF